MRESSRGQRMERLRSGLVVPTGTGVQVDREPDPPEVQWALTYITASELVDETIGVEQVVDALRGLSAQDCLRLVGSISAQLHAAPRPTNGRLQRELVDGVAKGTELARLVKDALDAAERPRVAFFEQQLIHLARLATLHGDLRPGEGMPREEERSSFLIALFGVTDFLDANLRIEDESERLSWAVRQGALNHGFESLTLWSLYYDLLIRLWPEVPTADSFEVEQAFRRYAGLSLRDYFTFAFGTFGRFASFADDPASGISISPQSWFSSTDITETEWRPYFDLVSRPLESLREALVAEEKKYGSTTYGCQTFAETPLLYLGDDRFVPINMTAFERSATEGVFFVLADGAEEEGMARQSFTAPFGKVFEEAVQRTFERFAPSGGTGPRVHRDFSYGRKHARKLSSDVILDYGSELVFVEAVAGQLRVATRTRGDLVSLRQDLRKLVIEKAQQLDRCIHDFRSGLLEVPGFIGGRDAFICPVLVTSVSLPYTPPVAEEISGQLRRNALLARRGVAPLAVISFEELAAAEGLVESGASFLELIRGWVSSRRTRINSFKNYLIGTASPRRSAPPGSYQIECFEEAADEMYGRLFQSPPPSPLRAIRQQG